MKTSELLFDILRAEVNCNLINAEKYRDYDAKALYNLAINQDLMYFVADALDKVNLLPKEKDLYSAYQNSQIAVVYRTTQIESVFEKIKTVLSEAEIAFIPLKGAVLRNMYPDKMMRSSCDIDILVKEEELQKAVKALVFNGFTTDGKRDYHDVSLHFGSVHLELHFNICEDMDDIDELLKQVWDYAEPVSEYEYAEKPEFFVYHHLAHMKYHFINGGCGIRTFLDLFMIRKIGFYDEEKLTELLDIAGLKKFYYAVLDMLGVWFYCEPHNEITQKCEEYILFGGIYGNTENSSAAQSAAHDGRIKNAWRVVFPGYFNMCNLYPAVKEKKILLPYYYLHRIFRKTFGKSGKRVIKKMTKIMTVDESKIDSIGELLIAMGLKNGENV